MKMQANQSPDSVKMGSVYWMNPVVPVRSMGIVGEGYGPELPGD